MAGIFKPRQILSTDRRKLPDKFMLLYRTNKPTIVWRSSLKHLSRLSAVASGTGLNVAVLNFLVTTHPQHTYGFALCSELTFGFQHIYDVVYIPDGIGLRQ